jgi:hypothetical protein
MNRGTVRQVERWTEWAKNDRFITEKNRLIRYGGAQFRQQLPHPENTEKLASAAVIRLGILFAFIEEMDDG